MPPQSEVMDRTRRGTRQARRVAHTAQGDEDEESQSITEPSQSSQTPRSVYLTPLPLTRELSDLSGSYANGTSGKGGVPGVIYPKHAPGAGPWRQAYVASKLPPPSKKIFSAVSSPGRIAPFMTGRNESVEVIDELVEDISFDLGLEAREHNRIPVTVLLMDGSKHSYELIQVWIDRAVDSVRDVVQAVQRGIPDMWKIGYDGIFQVRGNRFTQLIHILRMTKYDVQPNEILIAKPWSMTAKATIAYATSVIRHLTNIQVINPDEEDKAGQRLFRPKSEDGPLLLSREAQKRIYSPDGVLNHHHATQFLSFSPPFDSKFQTKFQSNEDAFSVSNISSISGSVHQFQGSLVENLIANLRAKAKEEAEAAVVESEDRQPQTTPQTEPVSRTDPSPSEALSPSPVEVDTVPRVPRDVNLDLCSTRTRRNNVTYTLSQLNCCKSKDRVAALACCPPPEAIKDSCEITSALRCCKTKTASPPLLAVQEEDCTGFDVRPVGEDRSRASSRQSGSTQHQYSSKVSVPSLSRIESSSSSFPEYTITRKARGQLVEI